MTIGNCSACDVLQPKNTRIMCSSYSHIGLL
jgi:hypothetical protein